ncbi:mCG146294, partial [Mus musculus]
CQQTISGKEIITQCRVKTIATHAMLYLTLCQELLRVQQKCIAYEKTCFKEKEELLKAAHL